MQLSGSRELHVMLPVPGYLSDGLSGSSLANAQAMIDMIINQGS